MENDKSKIEEKYKGKVLAFTLYQSGSGPFYVKDFIDFDKLAYILDEIHTGESDITRDGIYFLKEYYSFDDLAKKLSDDNWYGYSIEEAKEFLENMNPFVGANFITNVRKGSDIANSLKSDKAEFNKVKIVIENIIQGMGKLNDYYLKLKEEQKEDFIIDSYNFTYSFPNDADNFIINLDRRADKILGKVKKEELEIYIDRLFKYYKPEDSFPINKPTEQENKQEESKRKHLSKMMGVMKWLMLVMSLGQLINYLVILFNSNFIMFGMPVSILGVIGSIFLFQKKKAGIIIGIIWSALQAVILGFNNIILDFSQMISIPFGSTLDLDNISLLIKVNFFALALLIVFIQNRKKLYF